MFNYPKLSAHEEALHKAVEQGSLDEVKRLLGMRYQVQINVNSRNPEAFDLTPMHIAAKAGHFELCRFLMTVGGFPYLRNRDGLTPANLATEAGHLELANSLKKAERNPPQMLAEFLPSFIVAEKLAEESAA